MPKMTASDLFARSQGSQNMGDTQCHWCGSLCTREFVHNDVPPIPFARSKSTAKYPNNAYQCVGCWLWQRGRVSVRFLTGEVRDKDGTKLKDGFKDGQTAKNHSWWVTEKGAWALREEDYPEVFRLLAAPPVRFCLALKAPGQDNLLQLMECNDPGGIVGETELYFTLGGTRHAFTPYEYLEALKHGPDHYGPAVRALWGFLGKPPEGLAVKDDEKKGRGRPKPLEEARHVGKKVITHSGAGAAA